MHSLVSYGARAWLLHSTGDLLGSGIKPVSPALADRFLTSEPPRMSLQLHSYQTFPKSEVSQFLTFTWVVSPFTSPVLCDLAKSRTATNTGVFLALVMPAKQSPIPGLRGTVCSFTHSKLNKPRKYGLWRWLPSLLYLDPLSSLGWSSWGRFYLEEGDLFPM